MSLCVGGPSSICKICYQVNDVYHQTLPDHHHLFQSHANVVSPVAWSFLMVACLSLVDIPIEVKQLLVDWPANL